MDKVYLQSIANTYGADHYQHSGGVDAGVHLPSLDTIVVELLDDDAPLALRLAACLLCHPDLCIDSLTGNLLVTGKQHVAHIAACGKLVEPECALWVMLADEFGECLDTNLPHWSRFCTQGEDGYSYMGQHFVWVRPRLNAIVSDA